MGRAGQRRRQPPPLQSVALTKRGTRPLTCPPHLPAARGRPAVLSHTAPSPRWAGRVAAVALARCAVAVGLEVCPGPGQVSVLPPAKDIDVPGNEAGKREGRERRQLRPRKGLGGWTVVGNVPLSRRQQCSAAASRRPTCLQASARMQAIVSLAWAVGKSQRMDLQPGAPLAADAPRSLPLVIFSHGLGGNRFMCAATLPSATAAWPLAARPDAHAHRLDADRPCLRQPIAMRTGLACASPSLHAAPPGSPAHALRRHHPAPAPPPLATHRPRCLACAVPLRPTPYRLQVQHPLLRAGRPGLPGAGGGACRRLRLRRAAARGRVAPLRRAGRRGGAGLLLRRGGARGSAYVRRSPDI